eukprot:TRINITY_DN41631_c0_g1_i1.p1 TRINITY_DN41631_c0_g1~~TRINITY_DN41631_c0_g1_i1.p1  ORF type:complete len:519 (-),score=131.27 TRINITY_DN41631_c0_g1_i1:76-1632(-)
MAAEEETVDDKDKGPLIYQESKKFHGEFFLINVYDNTKTRKVVFEVYGLDTQDQLHLMYGYSEFDGLFRFNAELMNPNKKEGRFHWVSERLAIVTIGKERKLKLQQDPTNEVPELPIYETTRKIPTGRMDLKERQRLRESMDMLDIKREENIMKRKQLARQRFLKHIQWLKEEDIRLKKLQDEKLADERTRRMQMKEDFERRVNEAMRAEKERQRIRTERVEVREERNEEQDEEDYRQLRARWKKRDAERAQAIADTRALKAQQREEQRILMAKDKKHAEAIRTKRKSNWDVRDDRIKRKSEAWLRGVLEIKADRLRKKKQQEDRKEEYMKLLHETRQPIFFAQLQRTEERRKAAEAVAKMTDKYHEKRSIPKKAKKKGKHAKSLLKGESAPTKEDTPVAPPSKENSVEAKMRAEMDEANRRAKLDRARERRIAALADARKDKINKRVAELREEDKQIRIASEEKIAERKARYADVEAKENVAKETKQEELLRIAKTRARKIYLREKERRERMAASAA